ncbi:hypothetical protein ACFFRR_002201 [Megaselia abdita]
MKLAILISVIFGLIATVFSSTMMGIHADPKYPGMCMVNENLILKAGDHENPDTCGLINCHSSGMTNFYYCPKKSISGCTKGEVVNVKSSYPNCCETYYNCPQEDGSVKVFVA